MKHSFGKYIRLLRTEKNLTQRELAQKIKINFTYLSKIENDNLKDIKFPSEETIIKIGEALEADTEELLLLAQKVPENIKKRVLEKPEIFRKFASLDDDKLNELANKLDETQQS